MSRTGTRLSDAASLLSTPPGTDWLPMASCQPDPPPGSLLCGMTIGLPGPVALDRVYPRSQASEGVVTSSHAGLCAPHVPSNWKSSGKLEKKMGTLGLGGPPTPRPRLASFSCGHRGRGLPACRFRPCSCLLSEAPPSAVDLPACIPNLLVPLLQPGPCFPARFPSARFPPARTAVSRKS